MHVPKEWVQSSASSWCHAVGLALIALAIGAGCDSDRGKTPPPTTFEGGFLGLADPATNETRCAECHATYQAAWEQTAHADAFATLAEIGQEGPDKSCAGCHNISQRGNETTDPALGFPGTPDPRLHNVQCESCHGPGAEHAADTATTPEVTLAVSADTGCGECHQGAHHPFLDEWSVSAHAESHLSGSAFGRNVAADPDCAHCHVAQSFIRYIQTNGVEKVTTSEPLPITCVTCHDPHGNGNKAQVRVLEGQPIVCSQCHTSEGAVIGDTPHHPQADMLLAKAGFFFAGVTSPGPATHGSIEQNPDLCATCHIATRPFQGGEVPIAAQVGHTFKPIPVVNEETGERNFDACTACHANPQEILTQQQTTVSGLIAQLESALEAVPEAQHETEAYRGATFNLDLVEADASTGVHNPRLAIVLLESSLDALAAL